MPRRADHTHEEIRDLAVSAAEKILIREGYRGLSTRKIAKAIGYAVGTLYLVFKNLDELILEINGRTLDRLYSELKLSTTSEGTPSQALRRIGHVYIEFAASHPHRWSLLYEHRLADNSVVPPWYLEKVVRIFGIVEEQLTRLNRKPPEQIAVAARTLWGGVHGICVLSSTHALDVTGVTSMHSLVDSLIENFLRGFGATT